MEQRRVYSYQRISTKTQDMQRQQSLAEQYCRTNGYTLVGTIKEQISGKVSNKKSIDTLLSLTKNDCDEVVVSEISRVTREDEYERIIYYISTIKSNGIDVHFLDDDSTYKADEKFTLVQLITLLVKAQGANEELAKISHRMSTGRSTKFLNNPYSYVGGDVAYGFEVIDNPKYPISPLGSVSRKIIAVNEEKVAILKNAFKMAVEGKGCVAIASYLRTMTSINYIYNEIPKLLRNRIYIGERTYGKYTVKITPVIPLEMFEAADIALKQNKRNTTKNKTDFDPLRGLLYCTCGSKMIKSNSRYVCDYKHRRNALKHLPQHECNNGQVDVNYVQDYVWKKVKKYIESGDYHISAKLSLNDITRAIKAINREHKQLILSMEEVKHEIKAIQDRYYQMDDELIKSILYNEQMKKEDEYAELNKKALILANQLKSLDQQWMNLKEEISLSNLTVEEKGEIYNKIIEKVIISKVLRKNDVNIQIIYSNF